MKSNLKKRMIALLLCMVMVLSRSTYALADQTAEVAAEMTAAQSAAEAQAPDEEAKETVQETASVEIVPEDTTKTEDVTDGTEKVENLPEETAKAEEVIVETGSSEEVPQDIVEGKEEETVIQNETSEDTETVEDTEQETKTDAAILPEEIALSTKVDGTDIILKGPTSSFETDKEYSISATKVEEKEELEVIEEAIDKVAEEKEKIVESYQAFDIKLYADGVEAQPLGPVEVRFSGNEVAESVENEETETSVIHVDENTGETQDMEAVATKESDVAIETTHFSIYVVVDMGNLGDIDVTIQHWAYLELLSGVDGTDGLIIGGTNNGKPNGVAGDGTAELNRTAGTEPIEIYATETRTLHNESKRSLDELSRVLLADDVAGKDRYDLCELWILKDGKNPTSITKTDWTIYPLDELADEAEIKLTKNATVRMVYNPVEIANAESWSATFFDYNVSTGTVTTRNGRQYIKSTEEGINSSGNYKGGNTSNRLAVGFDGHALDHPYDIRPNKMPTGLNYTATTGMVVANQGTKVSASNGPTFSGLYDPGLFTMEEKTGKKIITDYKLRFNQNGNTYIFDYRKRAFLL